MWNNRRRKPLRFGLRTIFVVTTIIGLWLGFEFSEVRRKAKAIDAIRENGGWIIYDYESNVATRSRTALGNRWLRKLLGENYAANAVEVQIFMDSSMTPKQINDESAAYFSAFTEVTWLVLMDTDISDAGLKHLYGLHKLERIDLGGTRVTTTGAHALHDALPNCTIWYGLSGSEEMIRPE